MQHLNVSYNLSNNYIGIYKVHTKNENMQRLRNATDITFACNCGTRQTSALAARKN